jgi:hypothetical protein
MEINQIHKNVVLTVDTITNVVNIEVTQVISPPVILEVSEVGRKGDQGVKGDTGNDGLSAYQIAINNGTFTGTEVEFAIMQASVANKLDKGGYQGTAQDLSDSIQNIYQPDTVIRYTAPTRVGNTFTFPNGGYDVLLSKQFHDIFFSHYQ